jgi:hypothetical protein
MKRKIVIGLVLLNCLLAAALLAVPGISQIIPLSWLNCCKESAMESTDGYCCIECCWFIHNCREDEDCVEDPSF